MSREDQADAARAAIYERLEREVDPIGELAPDERDRRMRSAAQALSRKLNLQRPASVSHHIPNDYPGQFTRAPAKAQGERRELPSFQFRGHLSRYRARNHPYLIHQWIEAQKAREDTSQVRLPHPLARTSAAFDDPNLMSCAGLVPVMALAERVGLDELAAQQVRPADSTGTGTMSARATFALPRNINASRRIARWLPHVTATRRTKT